MNEEELRESFRELFFSAAGGVSDMANVEVEAAMRLVKPHIVSSPKKGNQKPIQTLVAYGFVDALRVKRFKLGEKQSEFGKRFGVTGGAVAFWEKGKRDMPLAVIEFLLEDYLESRDQQIALDTRMDEIKNGILPTLLGSGEPESIKRIWTRLEELETEAKSKQEKG